MSDIDLENPKWWKRVVRCAGVGTWQVDENLDTVHVNSCMGEMLGRSAEEMIGQNLFSLTSEDSKNILTSLVKKKSRSVKKRYELEFVRKDGSKVCALISPDLVFNADGHFERGTFTAVDITRLKIAEDVLKESQNTLGILFDSMSNSLGSVDEERRVLDLMDRIKRLLESATSISNTQKKEQLVDELRLHTEHLKELVEERIRELMKAERLAAVGQAATTIAHDLRNPLQNIRLAQHLLGKYHLRGRAEHRRKKLLNRIDRNVAYADRVVDSLLIFSQDAPVDRQETDLNQLVRESLEESAPPQRIEVVERLRRIPRLSVDQNQMKRVFKNLILNAIQAMDGRGTLTLTTKRARDSVMISVKDTGKGISEIEKNLIWRPFHTSKPKGMGLGLSVAKQIVEIHGGTIDVKSKLGKESTFTIHLPIHAPSEEVSGPLRSQTVASLGE